MRIDSLRAAISARFAVIGVDSTLQAAALCLSRPGIGLVVVCHDGGEAAGVLTKSDLVRHLMRAGSANEPVMPLMNRSIISCGVSDDVYKVWQTMTERKLQNMPVLFADQKPCGTLDIRDAMQALLEHEQYQEQALIAYIVGTGYR